MVLSRKWSAEAPAGRRERGKRARLALSCAALATLGIAWVAEAAGPEPTFVPAAGSPILLDGGGPRSVAVGDVNGDGKPDLATANSFTNDISVLLGDGSGGFAPAPNSPFPTYGDEASAVVIADVNGDDKPDLLAASYYSYDVAVLLGDGTGDFAHTTPVPTGGYGIAALAVTDLNGDGKPDFVTANSYSYDVSALLGNGDGSFTPAVGSPFEIDYESDFPTSIVTADFNGDSKQDVATSNLDGFNISVLLGDGTGALELLPAGPFPTGPGPVSLAVGDVNGDGRTDLATANYLTDDSTVLLNNGAGGFTPAAGSPFATGQYYVAAVRIADVNGDNKADLVHTHFDGTATVLLGDGSGGFALAANGPFPLGGYVVMGLAVADVNGDLKPDLVTGNVVTANTTVLLNTTVADTTPPTGTPLAVGTVGASNGQAYVPVRLRDAGSGVKKVQLLPTSSNVHLEYPLGVVQPNLFELPSPLPETIVYAVKNSNTRAVVALKVWDAANNSAAVDPVVANLEIKAGRTLTRTFKKIPEAERYVRLQNGTPGLTSARLWINGTVVSRGNLTDGQVLDLDVVQWMKPGTKNTARITATGPKGAKAILTIGDVQTAPSNAAVLRGSGGQRLDLEFSR